MKNLKLVSKLLMVSVEFPIEVGQLKTTAMAQLHIYDNQDGSRGCDVEFMDQNETTYMGVSIDGYSNWRKFYDFHKEMGIDFQDLLQKEFDKVWTDEFTAQYIKDIVF
jgi:hypothetical protein